MVTFYLQEKYFPDATWKKIWQEDLPFLDDCVEVNLAAQHWIYLTWYRLSQAGVNCRLSTTIPTHGIMIAWNTILDPLLKEQLSPDIFLVDIALHWNTYQRADYTLVQNKVFAEQLPTALFVPHWPQLHLQPRDQNRETRFENICFLGLGENCSEELKSEEWFQLLRRELGLFFETRSYAGWHDYSKIDVAVAIRDFAGLPHLHKPATKLCNAWLAGVPFIGGTDIAYATEGTPGKNYLIAHSRQELVAHLKRLKEDLPFRTALVRNGSQASQQVTKEAILLYWKKLVEETLPALAYHSKIKHFK